MLLLFCKFVLLVNDVLIFSPFCREISSRYCCSLIIDFVMRVFLLSLYTVTLCNSPCLYLQISSSTF